MDQRIEKIFQNFNFKACHKHMLQTRWTWGSGKNAMVPSTKQLMKEARRLLEAVADSEHSNTNISCGGFHAYKQMLDDGEQLELIFAVESWDSN